MRYRASEKLEIIRLVEGSHLPTRRTLDKLGIPRTTFYRWYDRYLSGGPEALEDRREIEPAPADNLQVGEVGLPELVRSRGLVVELICC